MIDTWLPCCHLAGGAYYWQQLGMFGIYWWTCCHFACRVYYSFAWLTSTHKLSCLCFASYKYSHHCIIIGKSFGRAFSSTTSFQFVSWRVCIMVVTRAGAIMAAAKAVSKSCEDEKKRKSSARTCKWHECQSAISRRQHCYDLESESDVSLWRLLSTPTILAIFINKKAACLSSQSLKSIDIYIRLLK